MVGTIINYPILGGRTMTDQEEQSLKEARRKEKRIIEETEQLARDQKRRKDTLAREQAIEEGQEKRKTREAVKHAADEPGRLAKDQARRKDTIAREQANEETRKTRKLKDRKQ
jgi:hypothetical protein